MLTKSDFSRFFPTIRQLFKFGIVGVIAAAVNYFVVIFMVEQFAWHPLIANVLGFAIAYQASFLGHYYWTFKQQAVDKFRAWSRFLPVQITAFLLNEFLFYLFLQFSNLGYRLSLLLVLIIVPLFSYVLGRFWAFK